jgi:DNA-binding MarR family transcriptional regulator
MCAGMNKPKLTQISNSLLINHRELSEKYSEYAKSAGLTFSGFIVLGILWKEGKTTQSHIMKLSCLPKQTVNTIIKSYNKQGIIIQSEDENKDKRNKYITFTAEGKKYADKIIKKVKEAEINALDKIGEEKARMLLEILTEYKNNLQII